MFAAAVSVLALLAFHNESEGAESPQGPQGPMERLTRLSAEELLVTGWVANGTRPPAPADDPRPTLYDVHGGRLRSPAALLLPARVVSVSRGASWTEGVLYGVGTDQGVVYVRSSDVLLSRPVDLDRARQLAIAAVGVAHGFNAGGGSSNGLDRLELEAFRGLDSNADALEALWAVSTALIPICPGDRRCD